MAISSKSIGGGLAIVLGSWFLYLAGKPDTATGKSRLSTYLALASGTVTAANQGVTGSGQITTGGIDPVSKVSGSTGTTPLPSMVLTTGGTPASAAYSNEGTFGVVQNAQ